MMKKIIYFMLLLLLEGFFLVKAQIGIGTANPHPSAALDVSNSTNKAFLPTRVILGELFDNIAPVNNPAEGLIIYNTGGTQLEGFYIWNNGMWSMIAASANSVSNAVVTNNTSTEMLTGLANGTFQVLSGGSLSFNNIAGTIYNSSSGSILLATGKYSITTSLNIVVPDEAPASGLGSTIRTHAHFYEAKLTDVSGSIQYGAVVLDNATSNSSADKKHTVNFSFSIQLSSPTVITFRLAHHSGGTYENGFGGNAPNNGRITVSNSFIHIQKSL